MVYHRFQCGRSSIWEGTWGGGAVSIKFLYQVKSNNKFSIKLFIGQRARGLFVLVLGMFNFTFHKVIYVVILAGFILSIVAILYITFL